MVGKDGCLYELVYQVRFINRFFKINYELVIICRFQKMEFFKNFLFNYFNRQMMVGLVESVEKLII